MPRSVQKYGRVGRRVQHAAAAQVEGLEQRQLLSAAAPAGIVMHSDALFVHDSASVSAAAPQGYTPSQIRHAYGFDQVSFSNGSVAADGQGQTIAIVDAYNDPNVAGDLNTFDRQFGLAAASLRVVSQSGGSALPTTDPGWAGEISLDVEWTHAIAPAANILLVEANSATLNDLLSAVDYARHAAGVSVVSMSWGGSEFFSWNGSEFTGQIQYDPLFTTPDGHQGVTFVAAAGDSGAYSGVQWPASSPNVLSVGGTSLQVQDASGTYADESSWSGTSGGYSQVEATPDWQLNVQSSGARSTPDVSYDGDPNTGFAVYDSLPDQGYSGWQQVGGTSAGAPQWAALVAIADQGRALGALDSLDGATQTLPALYNLYAGPDSSGYAAYASDFNDVIDNSAGGPWQWPWGFGFFNNSASAGYDTATGLGSPVAGPLVRALAGSTLTQASNIPRTASPTQLPPSPITGTLLASSPAGSFIGGSKGSLRVRLTNTGTSSFAGPVSITLSASPDGLLTDASTVATISLSKVTLRAGASHTYRLSFTYPATVPDGTYTMIASIDATGTNTTPAQVTAPSAVRINTPRVDLSAAFAAAQPLLVRASRGTTAVITIRNEGNVAATGTFSVALYAGPGMNLDVSQDEQLVLVGPRRINLRPGRSTTVRVHLVAPADMTPGTYNLLAAISSTTTPADANAANDVAVIGTR